MLNGEKLKVFPLRSGTRQGCQLSPFLCNSSGIPSHSSQRRKTNRRNPNWKGRNKTVTVCNDKTLYIENPRDTTRNSAVNLVKLQDTKYRKIQKSVSIH